jgi:GNAT superfamily N-acetyltransferase
MPSEVGKASHLLGRAFAADPFIAYLLPSARRRPLMFPPFFRMVMHHQVALGAVWACERDGRLIGVSAWFPPDPLAASRSVRRRSRANAAIVRALFPRASARLFDAFAGFAELHPTAPHWYLAFIGVEPGAQGRGVGHLLLEPALASADSEGTSCYLETPFEQTHPFYKKHGFEITRELRPISAAPPVWTMTRPPQSAHRTES